MGLRTLPQRWRRRRQSCLTFHHADTPRLALRLLCYIEDKGRVEEAVGSGEDANDQGR